MIIPGTNGLQSTSHVIVVRIFIFCSLKGTQSWDYEDSEGNLFCSRQYKEKNNLHNLQIKDEDNRLLNFKIDFFLNEMTCEKQGPCLASYEIWVCQLRFNQPLRSWNYPKVFFIWLLSVQGNVCILCALQRFFANHEEVGGKSILKILLTSFFNK